jgi:group I intron endonuclease
MLIYKITNIVNNKVYIGQTVKSLDYRKKQHIIRANAGERSHKLYLAMRKHGIESFVFEELCSALKEDNLNSLEQEFILEYNSYKSGYNSTEGGDTVSPEMRSKISNTLKGHTYNKGKMPKGANHKHSKSYKVQFPDGSINIVTGWRQFCREHSLNQGTFSKTLTKENYTYSHKGFVLLEKFND